jgi:hypothetical protein
MTNEVKDLIVFVEILHVGILTIRFAYSVRIPRSE